MIRALYDSLTAREQDVVKLAAMDMSNKDIGEKLFICEDPEIVGATGAALLALEKSE